MNDLIFSPEIPLKIEEIKKVGQHLDIYARSQRSEASCPMCQTVSTYVHGRYWRHPQDLPCVGLTIRLHLEVRRFGCQDERCSRQTFAEGLRELLVPRARRTTRLREQHLATAHALGGEAGRRLSHWLGVPISGDTLIRDIRHAPEPPAAPVRVVGVDDWAMRKGSSYGTILVDLEEHRPIDILGSRETDEVAAWFQDHPEIEIVSRDRGKDYIKAASEGAPQAEQVADRWHLLANLREAGATFLQQKPVCLQAAAQEADADQQKEELILPAPAENRANGTGSIPVSSPPTKVEEEQPLTKAEQEKAGGCGQPATQCETPSPTGAACGDSDGGCGGEETSAAGSSCALKPASFRQRLLDESWQAATMVIKFMLLAFFLEALITRYVPSAWIAGLLGADNPYAILTAALIGVPVYTSNLAALPLISGLLSQGMSPAAALAFLVAGPTTTLPAMAAVWGLTSRRVFGLYVSFSLVGAVVLGYAYHVMS